MYSDGAIPNSDRNRRDNTDRCNPSASAICSTPNLMSVQDFWMHSNAVPRKLRSGRGPATGAASLGRASAATALNNRNATASARTSPPYDTSLISRVSSSNNSTGAGPAR